MEKKLSIFSGSSLPRGEKVLLVSLGGGWKGNTSCGLYSYFEIYPFMRNLQYTLYVERK